MRCWDVRGFEGGRASEGTVDETEDEDYGDGVEEEDEEVTRGVSGEGGRWSCAGVGVDCGEG